MTGERGVKEKLFQISNPKVITGESGIKKLASKSNKGRCDKKLA